LASSVTSSESVRQRIVVRTDRQAIGSGVDHSGPRAPEEVGQANERRESRVPGPKNDSRSLRMSPLFVQR
jgi:hypothetical protein